MIQDSPEPVFEMKSYHYFLKSLKETQFLSLHVIVIELEKP